MPDPRNVSCETRAGACLDFCERLVRNELPCLDDGESDGPFLRDNIRALGADLNYLMARAAPQTKTAFHQALLAADSMRIVCIDGNSKRRGRMCSFRCDACGRNETNCRYAIDLLGSNHDPAVWYGDPRDIPDVYSRFIDEYGARFDDSRPSPGLLDCDRGRFYVGETCLRKTKLSFIASTFLQELCYNIHHDVAEADADDLDTSELLCCGDDNIKDFIEARHRLEISIANDAHKSTPPLNTDPKLWALVTAGREAAAATSGMSVDKVVRRRTGETLNTYGDALLTDEESEASEANEEVEEEPESSDGAWCDEDDDDDFIDDSGGLGPCVRPRRGRRVVVDDDSSDGDRACTPPTTRKRPAPDPPAPVGPGRRATRSSTRARPTALLALGENQSTTGTSNSNSALGASFRTATQSNTSRKRPAPAPPAAPPPAAPPPAAPPPAAPPPAAPPPFAPPPGAVRAESSAASIARSLRRPQPDGSRGTLGSRREVVLDLMDVQRQMVTEGRYDTSTTIGRAVITLQELLELQDRA